MTISRPTVILAPSSNFLTLRSSTSVENGFAKHSTCVASNTHIWSEYPLTNKTFNCGSSRPKPAR
jgi:hypothetical protein